MNKYTLLICLLGILLLSGCQADEAPTATEAPTVTEDSLEATFVSISTQAAIYASTQQHHRYATQTFLAELALTPSPTATDSGILDPETEPLDGEGPWLAFIDYRKLWIMNHDGRGNKILIPNVRSILASPDGRMLAYIVLGEDDDPDLNILSLPENRILLSMDIYNFELEDLDFILDDSIRNSNYAEDLWYAVGDFAWSPDSSMLAFTSSHESPSSDVYMYDTRNGEVIRLTSGLSQAIHPIWSPDGRYIFHAGVDRLHIGASGAGYTGWKLFSVTPDGRNNHLYDGIGEATGYEDVLGWLSDRTILMNSGHWWCGYFDLRTMNIETGNIQPIWRGNHDSAAYSSEYASILVGASEFDKFDEGCGPEEESGLFLISTANNSRTRLLDDVGWYWIGWSNEGRRFIVDSETLGFFTVDGTGNIEYLDGRPFFAPGGEYWLIKSTGIYDDSELVKRLSIKSYNYVFWSPDGQSVYFEDDGALYRASTPGFEPEVIKPLSFDGIHDYAWIIPDLEGED